MSSINYWIPYYIKVSLKMLRTITKKMPQIAKKKLRMPEIAKNGRTIAEN